MDAEPKIFRNMRGILIESIWWDHRSDELVWVDITAGTLHRGCLDGAVDGSDDRVSELPPPVSAVQPRANGGFVAALKDRIVELDSDGAIVGALARVEHAHSGIRCNEGKVDPAGRFVVGAMDVTTGEPDGGLYSITADGTVRTLRGGFGVANGMEWSDAGDVMYVTDTSTKTVYRAPYDADGMPEELEPFLVGHASDGLALDAYGAFWNGIYGESKVLRWDATGRITRELTVPAPNVTSVAFGGPKLDALFVGTARENLTEAMLQRYPLSGAIFRFDGLGPGRPVHSFGMNTAFDLNKEKE